ncbi:helix-turn-helix transcriptional regulator [Roseomonas hellenica]|nr:winged helix-turn-helix domain-containing protein [Plastoroseomonas hellenica]MBR0642687.1 helix-turn-helix transcriptional regulator [Plastoroseomonas hellenica]
MRIQALAHPARLWIIAHLADGRRAFVSQLAREAGISRPLMKMHLRKLEAAELVLSAFETAESGKAANFYQVAPFAFPLDPQTVAAAGPHPKPGDISIHGAANE